MSIYPPLSSTDILAFQFSAWYPIFSHLSIKSTVIKPLSLEFEQYLHADGVFVPEGSEDSSATIDSNEEDSDDDEDTQRYAFPELDKQIRDCIREYGSVFPKLNFSCPKDAAWILPAGSPLKCTCPADVYLLLKSSDFVAHDIDTDNVFDGCSGSTDNAYTLELVLRKWYSMDRSREMRCFVRQNVLIGISQRDPNYYDFLNDPNTQNSITTAINTFWIHQVKSKWVATEDYVFDILLTRDLSRCHIVDFNPYAPKTDPLLFTYEELQELVTSVSNVHPTFRIIDSRAHAAANSNAPANQHNMLPFEALSMSNGLDVEQFAAKWKDSINDTMKPA